MIFISLPYSGTLDEVAYRVRMMTQYDSVLIARGKMAHSPVYKHLLLMHQGSAPIGHKPWAPHVGSNWDFWAAYSKALLDMSSEMHVLMIPGWHTSTGVQAEIAYAKERGIRVYYVEFVFGVNELKDINYYDEPAIPA